MAPSRLSNLCKSNAIPTSCISSRLSRASWPRAALPMTCSRRHFPPGRCLAHPKPRAMEIIDNLETSRRGLYGGIVGYLDFAGDMDTAIRN